MEFHDLYWVSWLLVLFLVYELYAWLSPKLGDTLSETVWAWFAINNPEAKHGRFRRLALMGFMTALTSHFVYATPVTFVVVFGVGAAWSVAYYYVKEKR